MLKRHDRGQEAFTVVLLPSESEAHSLPDRDQEVLVVPFPL